MQAIYLCFSDDQEWTLSPPLPWTHLRASLWRDNTSWMKAASLEGVFNRQRTSSPAAWVNQAFSFCIWLLVFLTTLCLVLQRTGHKQFHCFIGQSFPCTSFFPAAVVSRMTNIPLQTNCPMSASKHCHNKQMSKCMYKGISCHCFNLLEYQWIFWGWFY